MDKTLIGGDKQVEMFISDDGAVQVTARVGEESVWLTQSAMANLFGVNTPAISKHLKNIFSEGELDEKVVVSKMETTTPHGAIEGKTQSRDVNYYNLDAIIAVGYRVNSKRATQFRIWATKILREYIIKGFVLDDDRLKNGKNRTYFDELQERIREIRLSERLFYQKIKDIYATSVDYDSSDEKTLKFFKVVQNKLLWAISEQTAAELVVHRSNPELPFMGMTSCDKQIERRVTKQDIMTGKNYLTESEIKDLGLLVEQYLAFAEAQARRHVAMTMDDWIARLDGMLQFNGRELLSNAGKIRHATMEEIATMRFEEYQNRLRSEERLASLKELEQDLLEI